MKRNIIYAAIFTTAISEIATGVLIMPKVEILNKSLEGGAALIGVGGAMFLAGLIYLIFKIKSSNETQTTKSNNNDEHGRESNNNDEHEHGCESNNNDEHEHGCESNNNYEHHIYFDREENIYSPRIKKFYDPNYTLEKMHATKPTHNDYDYYEEICNRYRPPW